MGLSQNWGYHSGGLHNKDYSILGSKLGFFILGNYHICPPKGYLSETPPRGRARAPKTPGAQRRRSAFQDLEVS